MKGKWCASSDTHDSEQSWQMDSNHLESEAGTGDLLWVKLDSGSWWPALVVDEDTVSESSKPGIKLVGDVLVRLYGSYEYLYMDPIEHHSEFKITLKENNGCYREIFAKALEQEFSQSKSGRSKGARSKSKGASNGRVNASKGKMSDQSHKRLKLCSPSCEEVVKVKNCRQNGFQRMLKLNSPTAVADAKGKSRTENEGTSLYGKSEELSVRRMKVMQALGLTAPTGSPFKKNEHICLSL